MEVLFPLSEVVLYYDAFTEDVRIADADHGAQVVHPRSAWLLESLPDPQASLACRR